MKATNKRESETDPVDAPKVYAHRNPAYRRANVEFLTRKLRAELDPPLRPQAMCSKRTTKVTDLTKLPSKYKLKSLGGTRKPRKRSILIFFLI